MSFKNRQVYIDGDRRFSGLQTPNSRKLIRLWAEKEFRNSKRIFDSGLIYFPRPVLVHENVLVEELIGYGERSALRLVDVCRYLSVSRLIKMYYSVLRMMRDLYQRCRLVHGDLSEYNLLFKDKRLYLIDVGQATDTESPVALTLLRVDIRNINSFFARMLIPTVDLAQCLAFVLSSGAPDECMAEAASVSASERVIDCCGPQPVPSQTVAWLRRLHEHARLVDYQQIKQDDGFVAMKICSPLKETGEFIEDRSRLQNLGVEVIDAPGVGNTMEAIEEDFEMEEGEEEHDEPDSGRIIIVNGITVDLDRLDRKAYSKEQWRMIQQYLRGDRQGRLAEKKPKNKKQREKIKAMRKRRGQ